MSSLDRLPTAWHRVARQSLWLIILIGLSAPTAQAQLGSPVCCAKNPFPTTTNANVAVPELSRMLPSGGVKSETRYEGGLRWRTTRTLSLFGVTARGLSSRTWDTDTRKWSDWDHLGNPSGAPIERISNSGDSPGLDFGLPLVRGWGAHDPDWIVYQGLGTESGSSTPDFETARMEIDAPRASLDYAGLTPNLTTATGRSIPSSWDYFNPQAGLDSVAQTGVNQYRRHMFGTGMPRSFVTSTRFQDSPTLPLIELRQQTKNGTPTWHDHGTPGDRFGVSVGPGSATSVIHDYLNREDPLDAEEQHYVFVATDPQVEGDTGINAGEIAYLQGDGQTFAWHSLGAPDAFVNGAPVAESYYTDVPIVGGKGRLLVFAVARGARGGWHLSTHYHDGNGWSAGWVDQGSPPGLYGDKFRMTSSAVWYVGSSRDPGNLRVSAFGYAENDGPENGRLVEFHWNGATWQWMPLREAPGGHGLRTDHAVVVDEGSRDRLTVFVRTYDGRILEYVREYSGTSVSSETWNDLSNEPLFRPIGTFSGLMSGR
ncbi:MAG: hypothetical protein NXI30_01820 [bacterium]|nr:hypothetical protein [bacterium]